MEDYLAALEKLGKLLDSGVLTREEFEHEKAKLLNRGESAEEPPRSLSSKQSFRRYAVPIAIVAVISAVALSYAVWSSIASRRATGDGLSTATADAPSQTATDEPPFRLSFNDESICEPSSQLNDLLARVREAAASDENADLRQLQLAGTSRPIAIHSSTQEVSGDQVRIARLPLSIRWKNLPVTELRTTEWDGGTGFQIRFNSSRERLLRALRESGFEVDQKTGQSMVDGRFIAAEVTPAGSALTCMQSKKKGVSGESSPES